MSLDQKGNMITQLYHDMPATVMSSCHSILYLTVSNLSHFKLISSESNSCFFHFYFSNFLFNI